MLKLQSHQGAYTHTIIISAHLALFLSFSNTSKLFSSCDLSEALLVSLKLFLSLSISSHFSLFLFLNDHSLIGFFLHHLWWPVTHIIYYAHTILHHLTEKREERKVITSLFMHFTNASFTQVIHF